MKPRIAAVFFGITALALAQTAPPKISVTVEQLDGGSWTAVETGRVFASGAQVRFKLTSATGGWLYVTNRGTAGSYNMLFPQPDAGTNNRVRPGSEMTVPTTGSFTITGPPGHDVVYWLVTSTPLATGWPPAAANLPPLPSFRPRCNDAVFKSRGDCVDSTAGLKPAKALPEPLRPRELTTTDSKSPARNAPVIYELRLAHR